MGYKLYSNITCSNPKEFAMKNIIEGLHYWEMYSMRNIIQLKNWCIWITKNIGALFSKYEMFFLDQANFSSNSFQIWQLQYPIPRASLPPLPFLSNFTLANWNPSTTQSSSCSSSVSLFCSSPFNHTSSYWMYQTIYQAKPETEIVEV